MNNIKVSIITVSYNAEKTIEQTIKSVINQTYKNIEYIIIDGASTDLTEQIIRKYQSFINIIVCEEDDGLYYAMNKGINCASGDIIGILNSDDTYAENAVSTIVKYYQETDADIIYGDAMWVDQEKEISKYRCGNIDELWYRMALPHPSTFVKMEAYKKYGGFNTKYKIAADYELMLRFYCNSLKFIHVNKVISYFRTGGASAQNQMICIEEAKKIALYYINQCSSKDHYYKKISVKYYESYLGLFLNNDRRRLGKEISNFLRDRSIKQIAIWGAGKWGQQIGLVIHDINVKIDCFIDNDETKQGKSICGIITTSSKFLKNYKGGVLIAVSRYVDEIIEQIRLINSNLYLLTLADIGKHVLNKSEICNKEFTFKP